MRSIALLVLLNLAPAGESLLGELQRRSDEVTTVRVPFTVTKHLALFPEPVEGGGRLTIDRKRGAVRWEFTDELLVIWDGERLRRWDGDGQEEKVDPDRDPGAATMRSKMKAFLDGDWKVMKRLFRIEEDGSTLVLTPRDEHLGEFVEALHLTFDRETATPRRVEIRTPSGDRTEYRFGEAETGIEIPPERFDGP